MEIGYDIFLSLLRWGIGLFLGSFLGVIFFLIEFFPFFKMKWFKSSFDFFRAIPIIGLVPLIQIIIGVEEFGKIGLIAWGVMFPVWISVRTAYKKDLPNAELMLKGVNTSNNKFLRIYVIPRIISGFIKGVEIAIGIGWLCVVAAEWIGTYTKGFWAGGIGYKLIVESDISNWFGVLCILLIFGTLGIISSWVWKIIVKFSIKKIRVFDPLR